MKRTPQAAKAYAEYLYMRSRCIGSHAGTFNDWAVVDMRVRAFVDGVNWQKRKERSAKNRGVSNDGRR